ncbi:MAG: ComF family protein, partial [Clostridia bacterium]|nr:ComF family protein [Clostridia bacterium]
RLGSFMAKDMVRALAGIEPINADMVVPVPMHPWRQRIRDYNHAEVLAEHVACIKGIEMRCALRRVRMTIQQARLSMEERRNNLDHAIEISGDVAGKCILLVDDVCTTGATAAACERVLRQAGAKHVFLLCYALAKEQ